MNSAYKFACTALLLLLGACASHPPQKPADISTGEHNNNLMTLAQWQFNGKIALRSPQQNVSGYIDWRQTNEQFTIRLYGPLGRGNTQINGSPDNVTIATGDKKVSSADPQALVYDETGWLIPISELRYWAIGLASPNLPVTKQEQEIFTTQLIQAGWTIEYSKHQWIDKQWLPGRIKLSKNGRSVILLAKQWKLASHDN